jgi:hypothetical protein
MVTIDGNPAALEAAANSLGGAGQIYMVNLVRYRPEATYPEGFDLPPCSGREAYFHRYAPAFGCIDGRRLPIGSSSSRPSLSCLVDLPLPRFETCITVDNCKAFSRCRNTRQEGAEFQAAEKEGRCSRRSLRIQTAPLPPGPANLSSSAGSPTTLLRARLVR